MIRKIAIVMVLCGVGSAQQTPRQIDKPSVQDRADQRDAARAQRTAKLNVIDSAEKILREKLGPDLGDDPAAEAPFIHLRLMACLVKGDYSRMATKIYGDAADAAAAEAKEIDAEAGVSMAPPPEATEARQKLEEAVRREAELRAKPTLNGVEKAELDGMAAYQERLRDTIAIYERIEKSRSTPARSSDLAREMRDKEALLRVRAREADGNTKFYNAQCTDEFSQLEAIDQATKNVGRVHPYDRLIEGPPAPNVSADKGVGAVPAGPALSPGEADKFKQDERDLSDPDELQRRAERLKQIRDKSN